MPSLQWTLINSFKVSLVVGTLLVAINQWDVILHRNITLLLVLKILLTYCVPFGVSLYGALSYSKAIGSDK